MYRDRMVEVLDKIKANPDTFDMRFWVRRAECGTTYCLAGHAAILAGWEPEHLANDEDGTDVCIRDGGWRYIPNVAAEFLGLSDEQAHAIFNSTASTVDELTQVIEAATDEKIYA